MYNRFIFVFNIKNSALLGSLRRREFKAYNLFIVFRVRRFNVMNSIFKVICFIFIFSPEKNFRCKV